MNPGVDWCSAPALDHIQGLAVLGQIAPRNQPLCYPGTAHLILFTKLASRASTDNRNVSVTPGHLFRYRNVVSKTSDDCSFAPGRFVHEPSARRGKQDQRTGDVA